ncbi:MAG: DUF2236 domain-containing protein [Catenulispora sp.]|nr:DUF2236 domain-containing protein [Catenulispora sp.]
MERGFLFVGDPLADAVIAEAEQLGAGGRRLLEQGLTDGLASLQAPPPAVKALLQQLEAQPDGAEPEGAGSHSAGSDSAGLSSALPSDLADGDRATQAIPPPWDVVAFAVSMMYVYASPPIARVLAYTGRLTADAPRRLSETGAWRSRAVLPGGLLPGAPGYVATARVRLMHARVRAMALRDGWDTERRGSPINQVDLARTWLAFTIVPFGCLSEVIGIGLSDAEERQLYRYWRHIGRLLGVDDAIIADIREHADAAELLAVLDKTAELPGDYSRELTAALFDYATEGLARIPELGMSSSAWRSVLGAITRASLGDQVSDALGISRTAPGDFLPPFTRAQVAARNAQIADPDEAEKARQRHIAIRRQRV